MTTSHSGVVIVGSANMDVVFSVERVPSAGETLIANSTASYPGGKGLNQAVAASRAGAATSFVGAVGSDEYGAALSAVMLADGIATSSLRRVDESTGQAFIVVDGDGENTIIVASGANATVTALTDADRQAIAAASVLLMQLELPIATVLDAASAARASQTTVMLNAAPAQQLPSDLLEVLDYLIVNEHEACLIGGSSSLEAASASLAGRVPRLVVTLGADGSELFDHGEEAGRIGAPRVDAVDTTGAGDTFCGAFAAAIASGYEFVDAARFATAAAALSVQSLGAVPSVPTRQRIDELMALG